MKTPYPGYNPNVRWVNETGGLYRTCIVIEVQTEEKLDNVSLAKIQEALEATIAKLSLSIPIENPDVVLPDRFDRLLMAGLRLR